MATVLDGDDMYTQSDIETAVEALECLCGKLIEVERELQKGECSLFVFHSLCARVLLQL